MTSDASQASVGVGSAALGGEAAAGPNRREFEDGGNGTGMAFEMQPHNCFACGELNAYGLHLPLHLETGRCWTELTFDARFEGWEGIAHGGILSTILDEVMAWALVSSDSWGFTARLSVEFKRPVHVGMKIRAEGWVVDARRRVFHTAGAIRDEAGNLLCSADGVYVGAPEDRRRSLKERYGFRMLTSEHTPEMVDARRGTSLGAERPTE